MSDATLIDTLEFGSDEHKQKYEIYGDDAQTPTFAVISRQQGDSWQKLQEKISFAAQDEQQEATGSMAYGSGDTLPDLRDLPAEARERCRWHWQQSGRKTWCITPLKLFSGKIACLRETPSSGRITLSAVSFTDSYHETAWFVKDHPV